MVDLIGALRQLLLVDLLLRDAVTCLLQELQVVGGDGRDQLSLGKKTTIFCFRATPLNWLLVILLGL